MLSFGRIKFIINEKYWKFRYRCERFHHGYAYWDLIRFQEWFLENSTNMIKDILENEYSYPTKFENVEEWEKILKDIIFYFSESQEETCSVKNEYEYIFDSSLCEDRGFRNKWVDRDLEIEEYRKENFQKGMKLFTEYFWNIGI